MKNFTFLFLYIFLILTLNESRKLKECSDFEHCDKCVNSTDFLGTPCYWCLSNNICVNSLVHLCPYKHTITFNYNCPKSFYGDFAYSENFVRYKVVPLLCAANEKNKDDIQLSLYRKFKQVQVVHRYEVKCERKSTISCIAYLAILHSKKTVVLVFKGYKNTREFLNKITNPLEPREWIDFNTTHSKVDADFIESFEEFWNHGLKKDIEYLVHTVPTYYFWVVGYSQGGAVASIASTILVRNGYVDSHSLKQVTLGQPRVGDLAFAEAHDQFVPYSFRVVNRYDPVPTFPKRDFIIDPKLGPYHHRYEVWYENSMMLGSKHMVSHMAEDPMGRASTEFLVDQNDHLSYFDVDLNTCEA